MKHLVWIFIIKPYLCNKAKKYDTDNFGHKNNSILPSLRKVLNAIPGVKIINNNAKKAKTMTAYEESLNDVKEGRVYEYDSLNDFIKEIE